MKKSIYLIGAGASYNAIPVVRGLNGRMLNMVQTYRVKGDLAQQTQHIAGITENTYQEIYDTFQTDMSWLLSKADGVSIDTVAKEIFDSGNRGNELQKLKALLSSYIIFEQGYASPTIGEASRKVDPRYRAWFSKLFSNVNGTPKLPDEIGVFTWNYDMQPELSNKERFPQSDIANISEQLNVYPPLQSSPTSYDFSKFFWYRLNGTAGIMFDRKNQVFDSIVYGDYNYEDDLFLNRCLFIYAISRRHNPLFSPNLIFAFEKQHNPAPLNAALTEINTAEALTIIGYSFPHYNSELDAKIFQNLPNLKKVTILDKEAVIPQIRESVEGYLNGKPVTIRESSQIEDFPVIL